MNMTLERAAEILDPKHSEHYESIDPVNEACEIGRQAIFKQIKKRPYYEGDGYADGHLVYDMAHCPECRHSFEEGINDWGSNFCPDCGQALDWSEYVEFIAEAHDNMGFFRQFEKGGEE